MIANKIFTCAQTSLELDYKFFISQLEKHEGTSIGDFMERVLEWTQDDQRHQWLWEMFHKAFNVENTRNFFHSFMLFVGDRNSFSIEWRKTDYLVTSVEVNGILTKRKKIQFLSNGEVLTKLTSKEDPEGRPLIVWESSESKLFTDPKLLLEAMDIHEARELQKIKVFEDFAKKTIC